MPNITYNVIFINKTKLIFKLETWKFLCYCIFLPNYLYNYQLLLFESCCGHTFGVKLFIYKENNLCLLLQLLLNFLSDFLAPHRYVFPCRYPSYYPIVYEICKRINHIVGDLVHKKLVCLFYKWILVIFVHRVKLTHTHKYIYKFWP